MAIPLAAIGLGLGALSTLKGLMDKSKARRQGAARQQYFDELGQRQLQLSEEAYRAKAPLRDAGLQALANFFQSGGRRNSVFRTTAEKKAGPSPQANVNPMLLSAMELLGAKANRNASSFSGIEEGGEYLPPSGHVPGGMLDRLWEEVRAKARKGKK